MRFLFPLLLCTTLLTTGCSWFNSVNNIRDEDDMPDTSGYTEKDFYNVIQNDLKGGFWQTAIDNLEALEAQFPFGDYAEQAQLELIYARFKSNEFETAIAAADRFIRLHPQHPNVDYAYYLKGLSSFSQSKGFFDQLLPTDETKRDPGSARSSFSTFNELLSRFPESPYAPDAQKRMIYLRNILARHEIHAANYFFSRGTYLAAANRGRYVVENFHMTPSVPDGLAVMAQAYYLMQMYDLADDAATLLATNYPNHPALDPSGKFQYQEAEAEINRSWMNRLTAGLADKPDSISFDSRSVFNERYKSIYENPDLTKRSWLSRLTLGIFD